MTSLTKRRILWVGGSIAAAGVVGVIIGIPMSFLALSFSEAARAAWRTDPWQWFSRGIGMAVWLAVLAYLFMGIQARFVNRPFQIIPFSDPKQMPENERKRKNVHMIMLGVVLGSGVILGAMALGTLPAEGQLVRMSIIAAVVGSIFGQMMEVDASTNWIAWAHADMRSQIKTLSAQINPHFFFNTLNSISSLIPDDPQGAQRTIGLLADMSRYSFGAIQSEFVPLADELTFARDYLEIEHIRFGDRLRFELPDEAAVDQIRVPALTLQPLIENAVRHGISKRIDGGTVSVRVHKEGEMFSLTVENDVDAASVHPEGEFFKTDHALENVRRRLRFYYPRRAEHAPTLLHPRRAVERIPPGSIQVTFPRPDAVAVTITASRISIYDKALRAMSDR